jgi:hypothetical protein
VEEKPTIFDDVNKKKVEEILYQADKPNIGFMDCIKILEAYNI